MNTIAPRVHVLMLTHNCADMIPWTLRHYATFATRIFVWDDHSTDGTREILRIHPLVCLQNWPFSNSGISEDTFLDFFYAAYPLSRGHADWVMVVDPDEFIYHSDMLGALQNSHSKTTVCLTQGYNMVGNGLPNDDGRRQIWERMEMGVRAPIYSKPVVFQPRLKIRWSRGRHALEFCDGYVHPEPILKLLHYRYLGADYTRQRNSTNYTRCGLLDGDKNAAWGCSPDYKGEDKEGSPEWAEFAATQAFNVFQRPNSNP